MILIEDVIFGEKKNNNKIELTPTAIEYLDSPKNNIETPSQSITEEFNNSTNN